MLDHEQSSRVHHIDPRVTTQREFDITYLPKTLRHYVYVILLRCCSTCIYQFNVELLTRTIDIRRVCITHYEVRIRSTSPGMIRIRGYVKFLKFRIQYD